MGSTMSAAQEELIRKHTTANSQAIVILDEDDAGRAGRDDIAVRLAKFLYVKVHTFTEEGRQPEQLSAEEAAQVCGGVQ
jgi:DNA primase